MTQAPGPNADPAHPEAGAERPLTVLVVDDDRWTTKAIELALAVDEDLTVLPPLHTGAEAVDAYRGHRPDVVLMDINMPGGIDGIEATRRIRGIDPGAVVVILTTVSPGPGIARALEAGAIAAVMKSASEEVLRSTVRCAAEGDDPAMLKGLARDIVISGDGLPVTDTPIPRLSEREEEVLMLICSGLGYEEIAARQGVSAWTVRTHAKRLREKLQAENLAQLVVRALQFHFFSA